MPSLGRETLVILIGRAVILLLSFAGLFLYPVLLGPQAHGILQYYIGALLLLLGFLNGCAPPMMAHFIAIYRVSDPGRQGPFILQVWRWFGLLLLSLWLLYPFLQDKSGFIWIFLGVAFSGAAQLLANAEYGLGHLGPTTWFPVLILVCRLALIGGGAMLVIKIHGEESLESWSRTWIPVLLVIATIPALIWVFFSFHRRRSEWFVNQSPSSAFKFSYLPWEEIRSLGIASLLGQLIYQVFTRTLVPLAGQLGYPTEQVGYLGLAIQGFGLTVYIAGIFSISAYPWLVSANEAGERERFKNVQTVSWRFSALLGGWLTAGILGLAYPIVWVVLGERYHTDADLLVTLIQICALAGALMLVAEFHLRILISLTRMKDYLIAVVLGFTPVVPYAAWTLITGKGILTFAWILTIGVGGLMGVSLIFSPHTEGFTRTSLGAVVGVLASIGAITFIEAHTLATLLIQGLILSLVYWLVAWMVGLVKKEDLSLLSRIGGGTPSTTF